MRTRAMRKVTARYTWNRLRFGFWFVPALMALGGALLAQLVYGLDMWLPAGAMPESRFVLSGDVAAMRTYLVGIATAMLTTSGIVFTLLTLPLSTVATQYGSRLLRVFLGDRTTQVVLGIFVTTFVYCIAAATTIPSVEVQPKAPQLTATVGLYLMLASYGCLILLVQHIGTTLQAPNIAAAAAAEMFEVLSSEGDEAGDQSGQVEGSAAGPDHEPQGEGFSLRTSRAGYIQLIDPEYLLTLAREQDLFLRLLHKPGQFVAVGDEVALIWPAERIDARLKGVILRAFRVGNQRTPTQDIVCAVNQLVEMAVRAMSPAINDPFTAMTCLDYLGVGLVFFAKQGEEFRSHYDREGRLRLVLDPVNFDEILDAAFDMLRHAACSSASVLLHMLAAIDKIGVEAQSLQARHALVRHARQIVAESEAGNLIAQDRTRIRLASEALQAKLGGPQ